MIEKLNFKIEYPKKVGKWEELIYGRGETTCNVTAEKIANKIDEIIDYLNKNYEENNI